MVFRNDPVGVVNSPVPGGGGSDSWQCALTPWPYWSQLSDWTTDADKTDENATQNCGPESIAMCLKYLTGVEEPADFIKDVILGQNTVGTTTAQQLASYLRHYCEIPVDILISGSQNQFTWWVWEYLHRGKPLIWLRSFAYSTDPILHWCPLNFMSPTQIGEADPWTGTSKKYSYADAWTWGGNTMLGLHRTRWQ